MTDLLKNRNAQVTTLLIVLAVLTVMGTGAFFLGQGLGSEITGYASYGDGCNGTINKSGDYYLESSLVCSNISGIKINASDVILDCGGYVIQNEEEGYYGILIGNDTAGSPGIQNIIIKNCEIEGFAAGILISSYGVELSDIGINNNIITADGKDVEFDNTSGGGFDDVFVWNNSFYSGGVGGYDSVPAGTFCYNSEFGNFYEEDIGESSIPVGDCGSVGITRNGSSLSGASFYNMSELTINWTEQDGALPVTYNMTLSDLTNIIDYEIGIQGNNYLIGDFSTYIDNTSFSFRVEPFDSRKMYSSAAESGTFYIGNDADGDGSSVLLPEILELADFDEDGDADGPAALEYWDCNDSNSSIHRPSYRENDTSKDLTGGNGSTFCWNTVDDDCDNGYDDIGNGNSGIDWLDYGCGYGFAVGTFDPTLYINGTIRNISTSETSIPDQYYVHVNNSHGMVQYFTETDLYGVNLPSVFTIKHNNITVDTGASAGARFNKPAKVTFRGLDEYYKVPVIMLGDSPCTPELSPVCSEFSPVPLHPSTNNFSEYGYELNFSVTGFSSFTTTANSRMVTFTQNDNLAGAFSDRFPDEIETYHRVRFFANYTRFPDGEPINNETIGSPDVKHGGNCYITIRHPNGTGIEGSTDVPMLFDDFYKVYVYDTDITNFTYASDYYTYNMTCNSTLYEPLRTHEQFKVLDDITEPIRPVLYPQLLLNPTNITDTTWTWVAGYFNESDIEYDVVVLRGFYTYNFTGNTSDSMYYSEYKGDDIVVNFDSLMGENVTFTAWHPKIENALHHFEYVEFSNHNRTYFRRYAISRANRTGDDIRIEFNESLEKDVDMFTTMRLYSTPYPSGYFLINVSLYPGVNRIAAWGEDSAGNPGNATHDWINAPYPASRPVSPEVWPLSSVIKSTEDIDVIGFIEESSFVNLNMTVDFIQGYNFSLTWEDVFQSTNLRAESLVNTGTFAGDEFFYISDPDYDRISGSNLTALWVEFDNHNRTYWKRYNVTNVTDNPGEDVRVYIDPPLEKDLIPGVNASFHNGTWRSGWFNITVVSDDIWDGSNEMYAVAFRNGFVIPIEGYTSANQSVYKDSTVPSFHLSAVEPVYYTRAPTFIFNVSDDFGVNISTLSINISNSTWYDYYDLSNMTCHNVTGDSSLYTCQVSLSQTENGTYNMKFGVFDLAGWYREESRALNILVRDVNILAVDDEDDITNDPWLYFNWSYSSGELDRFEYALGTAAYPESGWNSIKDWTIAGATEGTYSVSSTMINDSFTQANQVEVGDFNGDGFDDFVAGSSGLEDVVWFENDGAGSFTQHTINDTFFDPEGLVVADFDNDGDDDIAGTSIVYNDIVWWENDGSGVFTQYAVNSSCTLPYGLDAADINGDGLIDLITVCGPANDDLVWYENDGSIDSEEGWVYHLIDAGLGTPRAVVAGDLDNDFDMDLGVSAFADNDILWFENDGSGTFSKHTINSSFDDATTIDIGDFDGDGFNDLVSGSLSLDTLVWWENQGPGTFVQHMINDSFDNTDDLEVVDLDKDNDLDLIATSSSDDDIVWFENDGQGNFTYTVIDDYLVGVDSVAYADVDRDLYPDLIVTSYSLDTVELYELSLAAYSSENEVNFTHVQNASAADNTSLKMLTGTVYYLTVRAKDKTGNYGVNKSSDGILFIDQTAPRLISLDDGGPWTSSNTKLSATWLFEDNESDIIEYQYTLGTARYPEPGYNSIVGPTLVGGDITGVVDDGKTLVENETYYYNVKARNGNEDMNYSGSWSDWEPSFGVTIDTIPPKDGFIFWQNQTYSTSGFVTIHYDVGEDRLGTSNNVKGLIQVGKGQLSGDNCPSISDFDWVNTSDVVTELTGESYRDVNVTNGYCYVFRLYAWDNASNGVIYHTTGNETLKLVKADTTAPSDVAPVIDDGFFTNSRTSLHANWVDSSDAESDFSHYSWAILEEPVVGFEICSKDDTGSNCTPIVTGNTTVSEVSINGLNLTHNHKYYFEVRAWNKAGLNSTTRYSNGIIYIDNAPPMNLTIYTVNEDNESSSPYLTEVTNGQINITAYGDLDGYEDTAACYLMADDIDYVENTSYTSVLSKCSRTRVLSNETDAANFTLELTELIPTPITKVFCSNYTNHSGGTPNQSTYSWYISCRDPYWNTQSFAQNTHVWFTVDWPEPPLVNTELGNASIMSPVYSNDDLYCYATIFDNEYNFNSTNVSITWKRNGITIVEKDISATPFGNGSYFVQDTLDYSYTFRGNNISCHVNASDSGNLSNETNASVVVANSPPAGLFMASPDSETVNRVMSFDWFGVYDDIDLDHMTVEIQVDNETNFNGSNDLPMEFYPAVEMMVEGSSLPGTQRNPAVSETEGNRIVYEDNRASNWDIYMVNMGDGSETPVAISSDDEYNPQVYNGVIVYEREAGAGRSDVYQYEISTGATTFINSSVNMSSMSYDGGVVAYNDGTKVVFMDLNSGGVVTSVNGSYAMAKSTKVYGNNILIINSDNSVQLYDISNNSLASLGSGFVDGDIFGQFAALDNGAGTITLMNLSNISDTHTWAGSNVSLGGGIAAYSNASGGVTVVDLLYGNLDDVSIGMSSTDIAVDGRLVVFESGSSIYYSQDKMVFPTRVMTSSLSNVMGYLYVHTNESNDETYAWRVKACDNAFQNNSCIWGTTVASSAYALFTLDNTPPVITSLSPNQGAVVAGQFRVYANIVDNLGADFVDYANYSITFTNGTPRYSGNLSKAGTVWKSGLLDFLDINVSEFTLTVWSNDSMGNNNSASANFTVNNNTAWFLFGGRGGKEIIDTETIFNDSIDSDFIAFNVLSSQIKIVGPLPATNTRFMQSKTNLTVTNHNYSDTISTLTWPNGLYRAEFTGTNLDGNNSANNTFYVDHSDPVLVNTTNYPDPVFATDLLTLSVYWNDTTLTLVNMTYNNTDSSNATYLSKEFNGTISSGEFNSSELDVSAYINSTFYWMSTARDGLNRTTSLSSWQQVFVESDVPVFDGTIPDITLPEDNFTMSGLPDISTYFSDPNMDGTWGHLDNLTYSATYDTTNLSISIDPIWGTVLNITSLNDFNGNITVIFNATDHYGKMNYSNNVTVTVTPVNDAPRVSGVPMPIAEIAEDDPSIFRINMSRYTTDVDGDSISWSMPGFQQDIFDLNSSDTSLGLFNFTLDPDAYGLHNITFWATDGILTTVTNVTVNITAVNDAPTAPIFMQPHNDSSNRGNITISWNPSSDIDNTDLNYTLEYTTDGGSNWNPIVNPIIGISNTSYVWESIADIPGKENVTLRLNATDGENITTVLQGNFSVDNQAPQLTINIPTTIMVGAAFGTDIITDEPADCDFTLNSSVLLSTTMQTSHVIPVSGLAYNVTYELGMVCTDEAGNVNTTSKLFEPRATSLEFVTAYATPRWTYLNRDNVNITIVVASNNTVTGATFITLPDTSTDNRGIPSAFQPSIYSDNKYAYLTATAPTSQLGTYGFTIDSLDNTHLTLTTDIVITDIYEVFVAVNQTLNVE